MSQKKKSQQKLGNSLLEIKTYLTVGVITVVREKRAVGMSVL